MSALAAYGGTFLPAADGWVRLERETLEWSIIKTGLRLMQQWSSDGDYVRCLALSKRLLEIEPGNDAIAACLVEATYELEGAVAATHALTGLKTQFLKDLGEVPPQLLQIQHRLEALN